MSKGPPTPENGSRPIRILDVAHAAGVSAATVSRALSQPAKVRPETRQRVMETVRRLDYTPNEPARALRAGTARMVLVAVPNLYSGAFFPAVVNAIDAELSANGYTMITGSLEGAEEKARRLVDLVYARQIDGVIILANCSGPLEGRSVLRAGVPVVAISAELRENGHPTVLIDDEACAIAQTQHLLNLGHRRLLYVGGPNKHYNDIHRYRGFRQAIREACLSSAGIRRFEGDFTLASGVAAGLFFLRERPRPTGVVCASDEMAIGFLKTVTAAGVKAPQEVSVIGFDDIEFAEFCEPALTTIHQPRGELGAVGARVLLQRLKGDPTVDKPIVIKGELRVRSSSGPAPSRSSLVS
ncbi:MAG: LacI family DNA-binding transcriptional regulator [Hyphomicrobiales bacterium]|nr:LacI family DNA-binding transcriptional regulator [Hyphomicrobiales bacterium]